MKKELNIKDLHEEKLLEKFFETSDINFLGELYRRYIPLVYGVCLKYLENKEAGQDAVMDIFETLAEKLTQYDVKNFRTWLYSVSKNHCLQVLRKENKVIHVKIEDAFVEKEDFFTLIDEGKSDEEVKALSYCMGTLPDEQQKSIHYFYIEEKSYADIVDLTGYALSKVKSYIQNGKRNLKICLIKTLKSESAI